MKICLFVCLFVCAGKGKWERVCTFCKHRGSAAASLSSRLRGPCLGESVKLSVSTGGVVSTHNSRVGELKWLAVA